MKIILVLLFTCSIANADFLIFSKSATADNVSDVKILIDKLNIRLGYPNKEGTNNYADPIVHPTEDMIAIKIVGNIKDFHLDPSEKVKVIKDLDATWEAAEVFEDPKKIPEKKI